MNNKGKRPECYLLTLVNFAPVISSKGSPSLSDNFEKSTSRGELNRQLKFMASFAVYESKRTRLCLKFMATFAV